MAPIRRRLSRPSSLLGSKFSDQDLMAVSTGNMSTNPPALSMACTGDRRGRQPDSEEDSLAFSLMMLSRGVREEPVAFLADVAAPPSPPQHVADVPASVAHGLAQEPVLVLNQASSAPAVAAASQTPPSLAVFAPGQSAGQVLPSPVVAVEPSLVLEQVVPPSQAPAPVLATTQAREHMAVVGSKRAAPKPKPTTKPRKAPKTVAAQAQSASQAPEQAASQATEQVESQAPEQVESQASEQVASEVPEQVATRSPEQVASQAPEQAASQAPEQVANQELLQECVVCHKTFNRSRSLVLVLNQASSTPAVTAATQTPSSLGVFATGQAPGQVLPSPVLAVEPSLALQQVVLPSQATAPVLATTQAREHTAVVGPKRAAPNPKPTTKPRKVPKTVAAQAQRASRAPEQAASPAPEQAASQELLYECHVCHKAFDKSRSLNSHMKCHPDGRLHPCVYCMSTFPSSSALRSHVRRSDTCGGNNRRRLGPVAAAAIAWHSIDLNMPEI